LIKEGENNMLLSELIKSKGSDTFRVSQQASVADAVQLLTEKNIGALLVDDVDGKLVGIISERDIVRGMSPRGADLINIPVSDLMTREIISCSPSDTVHKAMGIMAEKRFRHLPIFEGEELCGVISIGDLVKFRIMEVEAEAEALRQYIAT
jgi:CBS domain-containing protein